MRVLPTKWRRKPAGIDMERNYVTVTQCVRALHLVRRPLQRVAVTAMCYEGCTEISYVQRYTSAAEDIRDEQLMPLAHPQCGAVTASVSLVCGLAYLAVTTSDAASSLFLRRAGQYWDG